MYISWKQLKLAAVASTLLCLTACQKNPNKISLDEEAQDNDIAEQMAAIENEISEHIALIDERYDQLQLLADSQKAQKKEKKEKKPTPPPVNPTARTCPDGYGFTTMAEFTYWNAFDDGLTVAFQVNSDKSTNSSSIRPLTMDSDWQPGFRVGIGYNAVYDDWWTDLNYTYFRSRDTISRNPFTKNSIFLVSILENPLVNQGNNLSTNDFNLHWKLGVDLLDLEMGRNFFVSNRLSLSPFASVRGVWIRRHIKVNSDGTQDTQSNSSTGRQTITQNWTDSLRMKQDIWAVGPRIGVNTRWLFGKSGFAFFMNADGALMYSGITVHDKENNTTVDSTNGTQNQTATLKKTLHRVMPNLSLFGGLDYQHCWSDSDFALHVYAGYSITYFWNQEYFYTPTNLNPQGNLGLQGLNAGLKFEW
jgi:hypothetical protein